jgi:predicted Zn finger-like uncharacterized protein
MSIIIDCPSCQRKLRVSEQLQGQAVKCPTCGATFDSVNVPPSPPLPFASDDTLAQPTARDGAGLRSLDDDSFRDRPLLEPAMTEEICPNCGKAVSPDDIRCSACGEDLLEEDESPEPRERRDWEPHRGGLLLGLGIASIVLGMCVIGLPLGICAWVMGHKDLNKMKARTMDPEGMGLAQGGWICGIIGTIISTLTLFGCLGYWALVISFVSVMRTAPPVPAGPGGPPPQVAPVKKAAPPVRIEVKPQGKKAQPKGEDKLEADRLP